MTVLHSAPATAALIYRSQRAEVLSNNIANADTPNFKARDLDFPALLASQSKQMTDAQFSLQTTNLKHIAGNGSAAEIDERALLYRIPNQPSLDQNTVDQQVELAKYTENEIHFEAAFTRLNGSFKGLIKALRGE
ncbi:flagellar basal body rod protein FlgB [Pseudomonas helleri]|uniref:flagellar basal body rod protein FlgB n=1 Tax=Pseudomonas helleri TaxID=1608996 RepID=UPI000652B35D|nr:flagellar basal body rod protein FlgB [Pseudomonas helleri]KMN23079.1 flagellar basal body rod protein FlgB [Pseudomonas helleri]